MEQHPIPQQISSYEFKLVGEMTLKQFLKAAGGVVLALIIYASKLIFFIKYPLILICGGGGLMLAFVPFQDRPLDQWILAFIKAIYSPTIYTYKKSPQLDWMNLKPVLEKPPEEEKEEPIPQKDKTKVEEFIKSLPKYDLTAQEKPVEEIKEMTTSLKPEETKTEEIKPKAEEKTENLTNDEVWRDQKVDLNLKTEKLGATGQAVFGQIPMPDKPDVPNLLVGMVTSYEGKIVEGAIVEIQDEKGNPSRVLKTNALGQFRATTPLANGRYLIITEKEGSTFDRVNVDLNGGIVDPVKIQAKLV